MRLTETLQQWLKEQEWQEEPQIDEEHQASSTTFRLSVSDIGLKCWYECLEAGEVFKLYMYCSDVKVPEARLEEVQKFACEFSKALYLGQLRFFREDRVMCYYSALDMEAAAFEPRHITNLLNAGMNAMQGALPKYLAICFAGKSAEEVLAEE